MVRFARGMPTAKVLKGVDLTTNVAIVFIAPYLYVRQLAYAQETASNSATTHLLSGLAVVGWLVVAAIVLAAVGQRHEARAGRLFTAALGLAVLYGMQMVWPNPDIEGLLTATVPLLIVWPFVSPSIPRQVANYLLAGAFYALLLAFIAIVRLSHSSAVIGFPAETHMIWTALTIATVTYGQLLLGLQRLLPLRLALAMLAIAAILVALAVLTGSAAAVLLSIVLVLAQFYSSASAGEHETVVRKHTRVPRQLTASPVYRPDYLYERRQLLSMRLASIIAHDPTPGVTKLNAMLDVATTLIDADAAYILKLQEHPIRNVKLLTGTGTAGTDDSTCPAFLTKADAPVLFHALHSDETLIFSQREWGQSPNLDALYRSLGDAEPGPTIIQPITHEAKAFGLAVVSNWRTKRPFTDEESRLVQVLSVRLATVIVRQDHIHGIVLTPTQKPKQFDSGATNATSAAASFC
jgi:hypothetical protein